MPILLPTTARRLLSAMHMNKSGIDLTVSLALAATPLALVADSLVSGFAIGAITLLITLTTFLCAAGLARLHLSPAQQQTILLIVAALAAGVCDLLLRAFAVQIHPTIQPWLPLAAIASASLLAFSQRKAQTKAQMTGHDSPALKTRIVYLLGFALIPPLAVGAIRELTGFLFILLPAGVMIAIALLIAAKNHRRPTASHPDATTNNPRTRRVRVTGPVS